MDMFYIIGYTEMSQKSQWKQQLFGCFTHDARHNMICPHCGQDTNSLSSTQIKRIVDTFKNKSEQLQIMIREFLQQLPNLNKQNAINFLSRVEQYPADDINFGIRHFLFNNYHKKGKSWEYCAAIIARRYNSRKSQDKLPKAPPYNV